MTNGADRHAEHYRVRDEDLLVGLRRELLGPAEDADKDERNEILTQDTPVDRYPTGVLYPGSADTGATEARKEEAAEQDGLDAAPVLTRDSVEESGAERDPGRPGDRRPSSMGLTFAVDPKTSKRIVVSSRAAAYRPTDAEGRPVEARRAEARTLSAQREHWRREELDLPDYTIDVTVPGSGVRARLHADRKVDLHAIVRRADPRGMVSVTVTLINAEQVGKYDLKDAFSLFQCGLRVRAADGSTAFVERSARTASHDPEIAMSRLLHRHAPTFAVGHGCSAEWDWTPSPIGVTDTNEGGVPEVRSQFVPSVEVLLTDSNPEIDSSALSMLGLAEKPDTEILAALENLASGYERWIDRKRDEAAAWPARTTRSPRRSR